MTASSRAAPLPGSPATHLDCGLVWANSAGAVPRTQCLRQDRRLAMRCSHVLLPLRPRAVMHTLAAQPPSSQYARGCEGNVHLALVACAPLVSESCAGATLVSGHAVHMTRVSPGARTGRNELGCVPPRSPRRPVRLAAWQGCPVTVCSVQVQ